MEVLGEGLFRAELANGHQLVAHTARRQREQAAEVAVGDKVRLEMSPYDMSAGRVLF